MSARSPETDSPTPPRCIFVVDDEPLSCEMIEVAIAGEGFEIHRFTNPKDALAAFQLNPGKVELLVTDGMMGSMNGFELIEACRLIRPELSAVMVSGSFSMESSLTFPVQPNAFVPKPYALNALLSAVRSHLRPN